MHFMHVAECGHIVSQCRCAGHKRVIKVQGLCAKCKASEPRTRTEDAIPSSEAREETQGP